MSKSKYNHTCLYVRGGFFISDEITQYPFVLFVFKTDFVDHISTEVSLVRPEKTTAMHFIIHVFSTTIV